MPRSITPPPSAQLPCPLPSSGDTVADDNLYIRSKYNLDPAKPNVKNHQQPSASITLSIMDVLSNKSRLLISIVNELRRLGIENLQILLPKIVTVGDQSAGKSSIIEAISQIKVPRASGTCTRCPIQIIMTSNNDPDASWTCKISLLKTHAYAGSHESMVEEGAVWTLMDQPEPIHLQTVTNKDQLENLIRLAQDAALAPGTDSVAFFQKNGRSRTLPSAQEKFSPNSVCLEISDRDIPNLSFCDLPGIINQTDSSEDEYLVEVVRDLVKDTIEGDTTLILLACSMGSDIQTSSAASIIRRAHAEDRCVGVLTKPDLLQTGDNINVWRDTLNGEKFQLGHGYFVTKQPAPAELDRKISHDEARRKEKEFFDNTKPWTTDLAKFKALFGTDNLRLSLAQKLSSIIQDSLPDIMEKVDDRLDEINEALQQFPPKPSGNAYGMVVDVLSQFTSTIQDHLDGIYPNTSFRMEWKKHAETFREELIKMRPDIEWRDGDSSSTSLPIRGSSTPTPTKQAAPEVIDLLEDTPTEPITPQRKRKMGNGTTSTPNTPQSRNKKARPENSRSKVVSAPQKFKLDFIKQTLIRVSLSGIPDEYDSKALDQLIIKSLNHWHIPAGQFAEHIQKLMTNLFQKGLNESFKPYEHTPLPKTVRQLTGVFLTTAMSIFNESTARSLKLEKSKPFTMNREILSMHMRAQLTNLENRRFNERANALIDTKEAATGRETEGQDRLKKLGKEKENLAKELGEDEYQAAVKAMAKVRAYYNVAAPRFVDSVCQTVQTELFGECKEKLMEQLRIGLGVEQPDLSVVQDECVKLLSQNPEREAQRIILTREKEALEKAQSRLRELPAKLMMEDGY